jgi:hypothetical protein
MESFDEDLNSLFPSKSALNAASSTVPTGAPEADGVAELAVAATEIELDIVVDVPFDEADSA